MVASSSWARIIPGSAVSPEYIRVLPMNNSTLASWIENYAGSSVLHSAVADAVRAIAFASIEISELIGRGALSGIMSENMGLNSDGDVQQALDIQADKIILRALDGIQCGAVASEEMEAAELRDRSALIAVAYDPLDGSSNIETNVSVGTIFSVFPYSDNRGAFDCRGSEQLAAGFVVYGPQTSLVLTLGSGVAVFTLDRSQRSYSLTRSDVRIPAECAEFAINASNQRHWGPAVRTYVDECLSGNEGPRGKDFNMRWIASLVAEAYRVLMRGGVFLYPDDARKKYREGRLRLLYEAHPISFIMEQAGGAASTGKGRVLDLVPSSLHQRVPLIMGSTAEVDHILSFYDQFLVESENNAQSRAVLPKVI